MSLASSFDVTPVVTKIVSIPLLCPNSISVSGLSPIITILDLSSILCDFMIISSALGDGLPTKTDFTPVALSTIA